MTDMRKIICAAAALVLGCIVALQVHAYPDKTITIVVPVSPGGVPDFVGRLLSRGLAKKYGQNVIVENRVGGGLLIGANSVAKANPDGHTMLVMPLGALFNSILSQVMPIDFERDLVPVSVMVDQSLALLANPQLPVSNLKELISYAKKHPGQISYGTAGAGSLPDIAVRLLLRMTDTRMVGIPYGGTTQATTDLLTNRIQLLFIPLGSALPHIKSGKLRALGVSTSTRDPGAPEIPSISEELPGYSLPTWQALMITGGTPPEIIDRLNKDVNEVTMEPEAVASFKRLHLRRRPAVNAAEDKAFILSEFAKWKKVFSDVGLIK
jgi:tripartite-type tricarboxylate transporter receptor subunit TctC